MNAIIEIIKEMGTPGTNVNPTEIYNEGWMTRLLMHYSVKEELKFEDIGIEIDTTFKNIHWTSEALISSPFVSAKSKREGYTHPDITLGDFNVDYCNSGKLEVKKEAKVFGIIEAKMKSLLSTGTTNAKEFNQASRTVACIASNTPLNCETFFYVVAPESKIKPPKRGENRMLKMMKEDTIIREIGNRFKSHNLVNESISSENGIIERAKKCKTGVITYEHWIDNINDKNAREELNAFYFECMKWNKIK